MAKSTKALLTGRIQMCKTTPSIAHIGLATHGRSIQIGSSDFAFYDRGISAERAFCGNYATNNQIPHLRAKQTQLKAENWPKLSSVGHAYRDISVPRSD